MRMMQLFDDFDDYDDNAIAEIKNQNVFTLQLYFQQFVHDKQVNCFCSNISTFCHRALQILMFDPKKRSVSKLVREKTNFGIVIDKAQRTPPHKTIKNVSHNLKLNLGHHEYPRWVELCCFWRLAGWCSSMCLFSLLDPLLKILHL